MQSLLKGKVREKEHSRCETMIVKGSSAAVRLVSKGDRNLPFAKIANISRNLKLRSRTRCPPRSYYFAICHSYSVIAMRDSLIPPNINFDEGDDDVWLWIAPLPISRSVKTCMTNSFGFGGHNVVLVLKLL
jgi:hypothetical protein